jgi:hypothetical protein
MRPKLRVVAQSTSNLTSQVTVCATVYPGPSHLPKFHAARDYGDPAKAIQIYRLLADIQLLGSLAGSMVGDTIHPLISTLSHLIIKEMEGLARDDYQFAESILENLSKLLRCGFTQEKDGRAGAQGWGSLEDDRRGPNAALSGVRGAEHRPPWPTKCLLRMHVLQLHVARSAAAHQ